jgi:dihydroflavonol-4-reductase
VTGASGFLGRPLVAALAATGRHVTGLARHLPADSGGASAPSTGNTHGTALAAAARPLSQGPPDPAAQPVRWVQGDVRQPRSYLQHLHPGMAVYHLAALRSHAGRRRGDFAAVNVTACRDLARHCLERGASRFVLVATAHLYGPSDPGSPPHREEDAPAAATASGAVTAGIAGTAGAGGEPALGCYERSRAAALLEVRRLVAKGLDAITLCPTIIFGPDHPSHPNIVTGELRRVVHARRRCAILIGGGTARRDLIHVDDVVAAALAAERLASPGTELLLGGEAISHRELLMQAQALTGRRPFWPPLSIPGPAALAAARAADRLLRYDPGCGHAAAVLRSLREWRYDCARARLLLGFQPRPLVEGLAATLRWLRNEEAKP